MRPGTRRGVSKSAKGGRGETVLSKTVRTGRACAPSCTPMLALHVQIGLTSPPSMHEGRLALALSVSDVLW